MVRLNKLYNATEQQTGLQVRTENPDAKIALKMHGNFSYGVVPVKDKAEKDEAIAKLKKKDEEEQKKIDEQKGKITKFIDRMKFQKKKEYELELKPRSLNDIISLKDINLEVKKGSLIIIIGKIQSGKTSLMKAMVGEMLAIP